MNCPIGIRKNLGKRGSLILAILSFVIPLAVWSAVSYIPFIYHPLVQISDAGGSLFCEPGDEIAKENPQYLVGKVNVDSEMELAAEFGVESIPMLVVMKNGEIVNKSVGARPKAQILAMLSE